MKIALSIICISIFCVSFRGIIGYGRLIENDMPNPKEIKKNLEIIGGIIAILALLMNLPEVKAISMESNPSGLLLKIG